MHKEGRYFTVNGKVQGVFFRAYTQKQANLLNLIGWVKNLPTGQVAIKAFGNDKDLQRLNDWLWQGSPQSKVSKVVSEKIDVEEEWKDFSIKE